MEHLSTPETVNPRELGELHAVQEMQATIAFLKQERGFAQEETDA